MATSWSRSPLKRSALFRSTRNSSRAARPCESRATRPIPADRGDRCDTEPIDPQPLAYDIVDVTLLRHGVLRLRFADGLTGDVDVLDRMYGPVFADARTPAGFASAAIDPEIGTVVWPNGADLAPDALYERIRTGRWPDQDLTT